MTTLIENFSWIFNFLNLSEHISSPNLQRPDDTGKQPEVEMSRVCSSNFSSSINPTINQHEIVFPLSFPNSNV